MRLNTVRNRSVAAVVLAGAIVGASGSAGHAYEVVAVTNGGVIEGKIVFAGAKPPARKILPSKDRDVCGGIREVEQVQLSPDKGVAEAVVWVKRVEKGKAWEKTTTPAVLSNANCDFSPRVQAIAVGAEMEIANNDPVFHNLHSFLGKATVHNVSLPKSGRRIRRTFEEPGLVRIECDLHSWMLAWVYVADSPYYVVTGADGRFVIRDLPAGTYTLAAWHDYAGTSEVAFTAAAGATVPVNLTLGQRPAAR